MESPYNFHQDYFCFAIVHSNFFTMPDNKLETAKNIGVSVAGSIGGNKVADKLHLGNVGHIAGGIGGGILASEAENKAENKVEEKKD